VKQYYSSSDCCCNKAFWFFFLYYPSQLFSTYLLCYSVILYHESPRFCLLVYIPQFFSLTFFLT
jgi:hypothetical protein